MKKPTAKAHELRPAPDLVLSSCPYLHTILLLFHLDILGVLMQTCWGTVGLLCFFYSCSWQRTKRWNQTTCLTTHNTTYHGIGIWIDPCHWHPFPTKWNISSCMVSLAERHRHLQDLANSSFFYYCVFMCFCVCMCAWMWKADRCWCQMPWLISVCMCVCDMSIHTYIYECGHTHDIRRQPQM